ncbi:predicted protein [Botrytis cinerea T4]|uniref:Uncharacterized protein n=1 Tax=Botryotinia fuckeliana (strain T4) TaxID=999810 RepID=G2YJ37_BOTF4|nr:predicted protein [Botrytis cinerea T4]
MHSNIQGSGLLFFSIGIQEAKCLNSLQIASEVYVITSGKSGLSG